MQVWLDHSAFPTQYTVIVTMNIDNYRVSKILVDSGNSVNVLYWSALDRMEDTPKIALTMIYPQTQSNLYGFDRNEIRSLKIISLPVRTDPYTVITKFYVIDVEFPITRSSGGHGSK